MIHHHHTLQDRGITAHDHTPTPRRAASMARRLGAACRVPAVLAAAAMAAMPLAGLAEGRQMQYTPDAQGYIVCTDGTNLYTRALYGTHTLWRLETSDTPIFGAYHKQDNRSIYFTLSVKGRTTRLDSVAHCTALYRGGERVYRLSDPAWGKGTMTLTVVALPDSEGAVWQVEADRMPKGATLTAHCCATAPVKMSRSGDLGVDPDRCFDPHPDRTGHRECTVGISGKNTVKYIQYAQRDVTAADQLRLADTYASAQRHRAALADRISIETPDPWINTLGATLSTAGDGIWDGETYQHGAVGWRMPLSGWRGAYTGDFLGWHDRARTHFSNYAASQVTGVPPTVPHPTQDPGKNMARAEKRWGTQMYSDGYICRNPNRNDQMHHYDMNLCYIDELLWHLQWTGDLEYARQMWPTIKLSLEWEKRNYDPDDDGLYDAYCCIWASDALYYESGAVTHSSAYNHRANAIAAQIAALIGEDPAPYQAEADKILQAINRELWLDDKGVWAESRDLLGHRAVHDHPGLWTVYHAIDSDVATPMQAYAATAYIDNNIPHIAVTGTGMPEGEYSVVSTTDWLPYAWSINNVAFAEIYHTALAYWQAGRREKACNLLKSAMLDGMYLGRSPGNVGQVSHYDAARGECYRDFADPVGVLSRAVVQGLFGFTPEALSRRVTIRPGWPMEWSYARISHPDFKIDFAREGTTDTYRVDLNLQGIDSATYVIEALRESVASVKVNGREAAWTVDSQSVGRPCIRVTAPAQQSNTIEIAWDGGYLAKPRLVEPSAPGERYRGVSQGQMRWYAPTTLSAVTNPVYTDSEMGIDLGRGSGIYEAVAMDQVYNANVTDIFRNEYLSPRSPYTTLQLPVQGIGEWCHPDDTADIDDSALRAASGTLDVGGIPFATPATGHNVAYASLFDNYPQTVAVPLSGKARGIKLLVAGSTNHMQCHMVNALAEVEYADGSVETLKLIPPHNWCPIEQDYYIDGKAFRVSTSRPVRVSLKDGSLITDETYAGKGPEGRSIDGGAATALSIDLDPEKELKQLRLTAVANDVVAGLISATLQR